MRIFALISIDSLLVYQTKYYLQVYLNNCAYKIVNKQIIVYLDGNPFERLILIILMEILLKTISYKGGIKTYLV